MSGQVQEYRISTLVENSKWALQSKSLSDSDWQTVEGSLICIDISSIEPPDIAELRQQVKDILNEVSAMRDSNLAKMSADVFVLNCGNATSDDWTFADAWVSEI